MTLPQAVWALDVRTALRDFEWSDAVLSLDVGACAYCHLYLMHHCTNPTAATCVQLCREVRVWNASTGTVVTQQRGPRVSDQQPLPFSSYCQGAAPAALHAVLAAHRCVPGYMLAAQPSTLLPARAGSAIMAG